MNTIYKLAVIGGGAAGLFATALLAKNENISTLLIESGERLGKKLSSTGNGQGNVTNERVGLGGYFSVQKNEEKIDQLISLYGKESMLSFLEELGGLFAADERGRVYPTGRQASAVTDLLRFPIQESKKVALALKTTVKTLKKQGGVFRIDCETEDGNTVYYAEKVLLCTGGKAAKNFGTDGLGYTIAKGLGHTVTSLYPSLVQLKTETEYIKGLKGIRVSDACVQAVQNGKTLSTAVGDIIFTDYGVSGDTVFRLSAFLTDKIEKGNAELIIDFLPKVSKERLSSLLENKKKLQIPANELLCGVLNNQVGRAIVKYAGGDLKKIVDAVKGFSLAVKGTLGYDYAQVTKGGVPLNEVDDGLQSKIVDGLYFAGEILDADGECGGFNLQFAYTSARVVVAAILQKEAGQV